MNTSARVGSGWKLWLAASAASMSIASAAWAQPKPPVRPPAPATLSPADAARANALAAEDQLMSAMANREMESLLKYYFKKNNIPADRQKTIRGAEAIRRIGDPSLKPGQRRALLSDAVKGVDNFMRGTKDTAVLMTVSSLMIEHGMKGQIAQIENLGESPSRQSELNDAAVAVTKLLDKTVEECDLQKNAVLAGKARPSDADLKKWTDLDERGNTANFTRAMVAYGVALSMDPADPKRKETAEAAIAYLTEFQKPEYKLEGLVKTQLGKLYMVGGKPAEADKMLHEADKVAGLDKFAQYEIHFSMALNHLMAKHPPQADKALVELTQWIKGNLNAKEAAAVSGSVGLMEFRIAEMKEELTKDPGEKRKQHDLGEQVLNRVMKENPSLEPVIKKMLLDRMPADAPVAKMDTVLLRALEAKGVDEFKRAKDGNADDKGKPVLEKAIAAAMEIEKRKGQANVSEDAVDEAVFLAAMFEAKLGKPTESVEQSLHYLTEHGKSPDRKSMILDNALAGVEVIRKDSALAGRDKTQQLIDQTWKTAIALGRKEYTFVYGKRLFDRSMFKEAAAVLKQVPENHPAIVHARFYQLSALQEVLDDKALDPGSKKALVAEIQKLAADMNARLDTELTKATEAQKPRLTFYKVSAILLAADLAQREANETKDLKGQQKVLALLTGFEDTVKGVSGEEKLMGTALHLRVNSMMALGHTADAVAEVKKLVDNGSAGSARILYNMIQKMDDSYTAARTRGDKEGMKKNATAQVALIDPLIQQTKDEKAKDAYEKWKADLLLRVVRNEDDETKRKEYLSEAQGTFTKLMGKEKEDTPAYDSMRYKLALVSYELKDYKKVQQELGQLIFQGKLGPQEITEQSPDGEVKIKENQVYSEGLLRFIQSTYELSKANPGDKPLQEALTDQRGVLKSLFINRGKTLGGPQFRDEYLKLKSDLLPGWDETKTAPLPTPTTKPATSAPAAAAPAAEPPK